MEALDLIRPLLQFKSQVQHWHWVTTSFAEHKAFGGAYEDFDSSMDDFIETFIGKYGRGNLPAFAIDIQPLSPAAIQKAMADFRLYLTGLTAEMPAATELLNIRDEVLGQLDHLAYRLSQT
jgi:hypothetical protein